MRSSIAVLIACFMAASGPAAQPARRPDSAQGRLLAAGTASISGRVTDDRGVAVAGATVRLAERTREQEAATETGPDGVYRFERIPDGQYLIEARLNGYVSFVIPEPGAAPPYVATTTVVPDQHRANVDLVLPRGGRIRGRVIDQDGQPVAGVSVGAGRVIGDRFFRTPMVFRSNPATKGVVEDGATSADGSYELTGLPAGELLVEARPPAVLSVLNPQGTRHYEPAFFPDAPTPELAIPVSVAAGRITAGIDIVVNGLALSVLRMRLSPEPQMLTDLQIHVVAFPGRQIRTVMISDEGVATVRSLREGRYAVWARARHEGRLQAAFSMFDFRGDAPEMALPLEPAGRISGRVMAARGGVPPLEGLRIESELTFGGERVDHLAVDAAEFAADGRFELEGQFGERRVLVTALPAGWELRQILAGRQDVTGEGLPVAPGATVEVVVVLDRR